MKVVIVIPARYKSSRFEGKPLALISGVTMIKRVYDQCKRSRLADRVIVATDDKRIKNEVEGFGGTVIMTGKGCRTGTDRVAEAVENIDCDVVVNVQGDEPLINPESIDKTIKAVLDDESIMISNAVVEMTNRNEVVDYNVVKAVLDGDMNILFYSRFPISRFKQVGLYVFRKNSLKEFINMEQAECELFESIELMRVIANRGCVKAVVIEDELIGVDVPAHIPKVERVLKRKGLIDPFLKLYNSDAYKNAHRFAVDFPLIVDVEPTNHCFLKCVFCNRQIMKRDKGFMTLKTFKMVADEVAKHSEVSAIRFSGWGEPTMNKKLPGFIRYASDKGVLTHLNTNGFNLVDKRLVEDLLRAGLDKLKISLQGATKEEYEKMRNNEAYDELEDIIRGVVKLRDELGVKTFIQVSTSITDESDVEVDEFIHRWSGIVDGVFGVGEGESYLTSFARVDTPSGVKRSRVREKGTRCMEILTKLSVSWNGNIKACCSDYDDFLLLGNLRSLSLSRAWNGKKRMGLKKRIESGRLDVLPEFCRGCDTLF